MENQPEVLEKSSVSLQFRLRSAAVFGAALLVSASLLAPSAMAAEDPQYGGIMTVVTSKGPPNYDPVGNTSSSILNFAGPIYNALVVWDPQNPNEIIGDLAETWEVSPDGLTYTFHLVENAMFHDGVPLTSADVKATFDFVRNPPEGVVSSRKKTLAAIAEIDTPDDYTVRFNLSRPNPALLASLAASIPSGKSTLYPQAC